MAKEAVQLAVAGNTQNATLLAIRTKGYKITLSYSVGPDGMHQSSYEAERDGNKFFGTIPEELMGIISRSQLVTFVRRCWDRIMPFVPVPHDYTVVEQFAESVGEMNDHDAVIYASEAALKAAGLAPNMREEQRQQAELLRQIVAYPSRLKADI